MNMSGIRLMNSWKQHVHYSGRNFAVCLHAIPVFMS